MKSVSIEGLLVAVVGLALAFVANALSPQGLKIGRDYFPGSSQAVPATSAPAGTNQPSPQDLVAARLKAKGLQLIDGQQVTNLFHDPRYQMDQVIFLDARPEEHGAYQAGHIPGAYLFDPYHPEKFLGTILPLCQNAQQIVVYCSGGAECEDSESAATFLRQAGIANEKLFVYAGGIAD
ncbi:MAG: hypothetical protein DME25_09825, partial [Verrucomicrobia bacterium]